MSNANKSSTPKREWVRPEVNRLAAGSAEAGPTGIDDGGPVGNARS